MLVSAQVQVDRHPVIDRLFREWRRLIGGVAVPQEVPRRACAAGHGVGLPPQRLAGLWIGVADPVRCGAKRTLAGAGRLVALHRRQRHGQLIGWHRSLFTIGTVQNRERLPPVALPREQPVAQSILHRALPQSLLRRVTNHCRLGFCRRHPGDKARAYRHALAGKAGAFGLARFDHAPNRQLHRLGKLKVALIVRGHRHDRASAVAKQHVVGNPHRDVLAGKWVLGKRAGKAAALVFGLLLPRQLALLRGLRDVLFDRCRLGCRRQARNQRMLRSQHQISRAKDRVGPRRKDLDGLAAGHQLPTLLHQ